MMGDRLLSEVMLLIADLAEADCVESIGGQVWERQVGNWGIWVNGTGSEAKVKGVDLPAFHAYIEWNGWPAGVIDSFGGTIAAGEAANEDALIAALKDEIEAAGEAE